MYEHPHQFLPLLPSEHQLAPLRERAAHIVLRSTRLGGSLPPATRSAIQTLLRNMNSYYSNKIEGQGTSPKNIDAALQADFSPTPEIAHLQRIALAHIAAEQALERAADNTHALDASNARLAHRLLYERLQPEDRTTKEGVLVIPGDLRTHDVTVGLHTAPSYLALPRFMEAFTQAYAKQRAADQLLLATACAHHRMVWMHPFPDGNGRAARLQTHLAMLPITNGLWSVNRGFARDVQAYYRHLAAADSPRRGDLDGRGNLTEKGLIEWLSFFMDICEDQLQYMTDMLRLDAMKDKIRGLVHYLTGLKKLRPEAVLPMHYLFIAGPTARGEFIQMTGLPERTGRKLLSDLLKLGLLASDTSHAPVRFAFPHFALQYLFPALYGTGE